MAPLCAGEVAGGALESEIEHGVQRQLGGEAATGTAGSPLEYLAKYEEFGPCRAMRRAHRISGPNASQNSSLTCLTVSMRNPSMSKSVIHVLEDLDHPILHCRVLGEQVVEAEEIAVQAVLTAEGGVAAVVILVRIVEPSRALDVSSPGANVGV